MKRCLILTGGRVDYPSVSDFREKYEYEMVIAVDGGLTAAKNLGLMPDFCVGDFDSVLPESYEFFKKQHGISWETHPPEKDWTDTELAINLALRQEADEIHIFGATGTRMDHTLASIGLLQIPLTEGKRCWIIDANNRITMIDSHMILKKDEIFGKYVSLIPYTEKVTGVTLKGMRYPLQEYTFVHGNSLGVSNEVVEEKAEIFIKEGKMILIESKD